MSQTNSNPNILFYSAKCKTCNLFMTLCQQNNILKYFTLILIDDNINKFKSQGLKMVPTIIVKGVNEPLDGKKVFEWLDTVIKLKSTSVNSTTSDIYLPETEIKNSQFQVPQTNVIKRNKLDITQPPVNIIKNNVINKQQSNDAPSVKPPTQLFGYLGDELSGVSDSYAYLISDNPLPKSYLPYGKEMAIYTAPEGDKLDKNKQDQLIKSLEFNRESQKTEFKKNIDLEHKNILN